MDNNTIMTHEMKEKDPDLRFLRAVYPNNSNGGGVPDGILVSKDLYASLWEKHSDYMRSHFVSAWDAGSTTFVFGLQVEDLIKEFGLWTDDNEKMVNMSGIGNY